MHSVTAHHAKKPSQLSVVAASLYLALFFTVSALTQLYGFDSYPNVIASYDMPLLSDVNLLAAALLVCLEVFAIPWLLWMNLSYLMRIVSLVSAWLALLCWFIIGVWQSLVGFYIPNAGLFGAKIMLPQGWWLVSYSVVLLILLGYVTWKSAPFTRIQK
jgi:hypothetical protein